LASGIGVLLHLAGRRNRPRKSGHIALRQSFRGLGRPGAKKRNGAKSIGPPGLDEAENQRNRRGSVSPSEMNRFASRS